MSSRTTSRRALVASLALVGCACAGGLEVSVEGRALSFCASAARTAAERARGLRGAEPLGPGEALLLEFPVEGEICIVNDGVSFPIDVVYVSSDRLVVAIERGVAAGDATLRCHEPTRAVLEVAAGEAGAIELGDRLAW